jgi:hypothetical protein
MMFQRQIEVFDLARETSLRRDVALAVLTSGCFDSRADVPVFGGFATPEIKWAMHTLRVAYTSKKPGETDTKLYDRRGLLFNLFCRALDNRFCQEKSPQIPRNYTLNQIRSIRFNLFQMGYALDMGGIEQGKILEPRPFQAVLDPLNEIKEEKELTLPNRWECQKDFALPLEFKQKLFMEIYKIACVPGFRGSRMRTHAVTGAALRFPRTFRECIDLLFCCRRMPVRVTVEGGEQLDGVAWRAPD